MKNIVYCSNMKLDNQMKLYLDTCSYNRPFDNQNQLKIQLKRVVKFYDG